MSGLCWGIQHILQHSLNNIVSLRLCCLFTSIFLSFIWLDLLLTPETKVFPVSEGARSRHRTSAPWPWKLCRSCPLSTSHRAQVPSPLAVRIYRIWEEESLYKNQQMTFRSQRNNWHPTHTPKNGFNLMQCYAIYQSHKPNVNLSRVYGFYF